MLNWVKRLIGRPEPVSEDFPVPATLPAAPIAPSPPAYAFTDPEVRIAAIGDLHGRLDLLHQLEPILDAAARDPARRLIEIYLGDYVDRGTNPRAVIDHLIARTTLTDRTVVCLAGNHEHMLLGALESDAEFMRWLDFGGQSTLQSYGIVPTRVIADPTAARIAFAKAIPASHIAFMKSLPLSYAHGGFFFAHAGVRPGIALDAQTPQDLMWIRKSFLGTAASFGAIVVHGHTPTRTAEFRLNRIGIDTGAYQTGILTCLLVTSDAVTAMDNKQVAVAAAG